MSRSSKIELLYFCVLIESLAGYAYDEKHNGRHTDGKHDDLYPHGTKHAKHDKDATFAYQIVETDRTFTYDAAGKLVSATETEDNYGTYIYTYEYDLMGNRTYMEKTLNGTVAEWHKYEYNESNQLVSEQLYNGKKTTSLAYTYDADGNRITETGKVGTDKVEKTYEYTVENRLAAVHDGDELLLAAAYDGDGNRVFLLNYNLHTDDDWKGNSGNGNGNNKDNSGSGNNGNGNSGNNGNGNGNGKGKGNNKKNSKSGGTDDAGYGNATNAEENNSQNQCGILFPVQEEVSATEADLIARIKTTGKEKNYELIEYLNDVNREHAEVLVEQNINGRTDTLYIYGAEINGGFDRISLDRFDGSTGYYLYDSRGSVSGITNEEGQVYQSYRYSVTGEITFGAPQYENEYTYNGESYNPNIESQYLRARYYCVVTATFLTEDSYLGNQTEPLTLNRYNYCVSSYLNYTDPSGNSVEINIPFEEFEQAQTYGDIYRLLEKYIIIEAQRMEAEHNAREQEMLNGMQRDYDSGFMKAIMELESDIGISGIYNIVVSPLRYAYQGSSDPYGEAIRNRRQNSQNFYVGVAQFGFDIVDPITHPELITGRIYSGMFAVTNDPGILFQDPMGPALDAWDAVWTDDDQTHFNKTGYLFGQILAAVGLGCAKSCIDEDLANTTTRTGTIGDHKGAVSGAVESGSKGGSATSRPTWRQSELDAATDFPGYADQKSFINGKEVSYGTKGSVRPDYYKEGFSVDIKNYNIENASGRSNLARNIEKQYYQRIENLPNGTKQSVMIDIRGQSVSDEVLSELYDEIMRRTNNGVEILFKKD